MRKGREADCDVNVPPVPEAPGAGPLPKYARGGRKEVHGDGKKGRRRMDRGGKKCRADGGPTPPPTPPNYAQNYADAASPGIGAQQSAASLSGSVPTSAQMPPQHYKRGGGRAKGGRTTPSGGVKASYRHHAEKEGHTMKGGSFPIQDAEDLRKAKHDVGRAHDPAAARRWINKRAGELGEPKLGE